MVDEHTFKDKRGYEKDTRDGISLVALCSTCQGGGLCFWFLGTALLEIKGRAFLGHVGSPSW
jgi:hypothetical protein